MNIVLTLTSWKKRIEYVSKALYKFLTTQTVKPNFIYLWLAEEEFPNKEKDLPEDLLLICEAFKIKICWTIENEYCFKRWYVFPKHWNDLVISIDDDVNYDCRTIEECVRECLANNTPHIIHYHGCAGKVQIRNHIMYCPDARVTGNDPTNYFMGQCAWTPKSYPLETLKNEIIDIRKNVCPKCDESFLHPFIIKNNIPIVFLHTLHSSENTEMQKVAIRIEMHTQFVNIHGHRVKMADLYKYNVLKAIPELQQYWRLAFPNYDFNYLG